MDGRDCALPLRVNSDEISPTCMAYARLFVDDIEDYFIEFPHRISHFRKFIDVDEVNQLEEEENMNVQIARVSALYEGAFVILDKFLQTDKNSLWSQIHLSSVSPSSAAFLIFSQYFLTPSGPFFTSDRVSQVMDVHALMSKFCSDGKYPIARKSVNTVAGEAQRTRRKQARKFLRSLPYLTGEEWFWDLVESCTLDEKNRDITLSFLLPDWRKQLANRRSATTFSFSSLQNVLIEGISCRPPVEFACFRSEIALPGISSLPDLRTYQHELVEKTDKGENVIICAPTGSGKTVVAAHIILNHLKNKRRNHQPSRAVMVVPKVFLVEQQANLLKKYAQGEFYVVKLSGDSDSEAGEAQLLEALSADIIVATPQILVNLLSFPSTKGLLFPVDITLLILDECHHTDKKNPYNVIMQYFKKEQNGNTHVVGLTASLGVGETGIVTQDQAFNHVVKLCLRISATWVSTVVRHKDVLDNYVKLPEDVLHYATPSSDRPFHSSILDCIRHTEGMLQSEFSLIIKEKPPHIDIQVLSAFPPVEQVQEYTQTIVNMDNELRKLSDGMRKRKLKEGLAFLKMYHNAMQQNGLLPSLYAFEQLQSETSSQGRGSGFSCDFFRHFQAKRDYLQRAAGSENDKQILIFLNRELSSQFNSKPDSRILIFCQKRETTHLLARYINENGVGKAAVLTSTNAATVRNGQSNSEQRAVIASFMNGDTQILVSTTVAEEGLDVAACNLIIKYNIAGNVISLVQQRGRARAHNSRSVLLAIDQRVYQKEKLNKMAEEIMERCLKDLYAKGENWFSSELKKAQRTQEQQIMATEKEKEKRKANLHKRLDLVCEKCNSFIVSSSFLRLLSPHIVAVDKGIWGKLNVQAKKGHVVDSSLMITGNVLCKCGKELGNVIKNKGLFLPALKADSILFRMENGAPLNKERKWKGVQARLLDIEEGMVSELVGMSSAFQGTNSNLCKAFESMNLL